MKIVKTKDAVREALKDQSGIGFVPTMGALHQGHLSLIQESREKGLFTVCSIFVNPTQFNNPSDLDSYPITLDRDLEQLEAVGCDMAFTPTKEEVYGQNESDPKYLHEFGRLESTLEGAHRPGHFKGVAQVVHILFEIIQPDFAFFGEKDFQQLQIIKKLVEKVEMNIQIIGLPTIRETDGLAMSSRNQRLTQEQRRRATLLYKALTYAATNLSQESISSIYEYVKSMFENDDHMELEYFSIIDSKDFQELDHFTDQTEVRGVISAFAGEVRLIDNMLLA